MQSVKCKGQNNQRINGFTLLEMVVAVAIFIVVILVVTDIFLLASRQHRYVASAQKVQSDARFAMELMTREIRMAAIDFDYYIDNYGRGWFLDDNPVEELALRDINNSLIIFRVDSGVNCPNAESVPCLVVGQDTNGDGDIDQWNSITPADVHLVAVRFFIHPLFASQEDYSQYCRDYGWECDDDADYRSFQHSVIVDLITRTTQPWPGNEMPTTIYLQTTATSRVYMK